MAKQTKVAPKGKQAPKTEKKTVKSVAPKTPKKKVEKVVKVENPIEETIVKTESSTLEGHISEPQEVIMENINEIAVEPVNTPIVETSEPTTPPKQVPLTEEEIAEKKLEAHYASLGQIEYYLKNIKGK